MAKVFTITEGLENMGAMKTGGQGSVYKGRRVGEIITAVKLLPTPVYSESEEDKNYVAFQNEVKKLRKVNEIPNPNVVKILGAGITESGNFPYIEMEYIEGSDLEELLKPPNDRVFTVSEVLKVAEQLSHALAHCHKADVKHGDIKSNNVKFNIHTGNYILLDFGMSIMSDEERRTSWRHAGAIEFMAPEQNEGQMFFQTDVYSFGVILFELLCGKVPFPLHDNSETARNAVMVGHLQEPPPDLLQLRRAALPATWSTAKKEQEMQVPEWLGALIYKCLEKKPAYRFINGEELHEYIVRNSIITASKNEWINERINLLQQENERLMREKEQLQERLLHYRQSGSSLAGVADHSGGHKQAATVPNHATPTSKSWAARNVVLITIFLLLVIAGLVFFLVRSPFNTTATVKKPVRTTVVNQTRAPESRQAAEKLKEANRLIKDNRLAEALVIYKDLARQQVPEAMFRYGNYGLLNKNESINCKDAFGLILRAAALGYGPAKRTAGFLYCFAGNDSTLQARGYHRCNFPENINKGSKLLMEALLMGDSTAARLLNTLNRSAGSL